MVEKEVPALLLILWIYDENPNSGEIFFGENSAGQTKWKCLELSAGEQLCYKKSSFKNITLRVFWMRAQIPNAPKSNEN